MVTDENLAILKRNTELIKANIQRAAERCAREAAEVRLVAVTKTRPIELIRPLMELGLNIIGENRVQEARQKFPHLEDLGFKRHLVGHLQTNKAKHAVELFDCIHSIDSPRVAAAVNRRCEQADKNLDILLEVNVSGEEAKYGLSPEQVEPLALQIEALPRLNLIGLMTMAPLVDDPEAARPVFQGLRRLRDQLNDKGFSNIRHLSMGMTQDYQVAVEEGATMVRIGSAIFAGCRI